MNCKHSIDLFTTSGIQCAIWSAHMAKAAEPDSQTLGGTLFSIPSNKSCQTFFVRPLVIQPTESKWKTTWPVLRNGVWVRQTSCVYHTGHNVFHFKGSERPWAADTPNPRRGELHNSPGSSRFLGKNMGGAWRPLTVLQSNHWSLLCCRQMAEQGSSGINPRRVAEVWGVYWTESELLVSP